jgi:DNA-binding NarL/FixJ family response regulator
MDGVSVLVVDDHAAFADAVQSLLRDEVEADAVDVAYGVEEAGAMLATLRPSVAIVDLHLADGSGIDVARRAQALSPDTRVVMMSNVDSVDAVVQALLHGVRVWLPKTVEARHLARAVRLAATGGAWLPIEMLGPVLDALVDRATGVTKEPLDRLSRRELDILQGLAAGFDRRTLAAQLHVSPNTIRSHVQHIIAKVNAHTTLEAVALYNRSKRP